MTKHADSMKRTRMSDEVLLACLVDTLSEFDQSFRHRYIEKLDLASSHLENATDPNTQYELDRIARARVYIIGGEK